MLSCIFLDWYCSTVQGLLDWSEVDLGFSELFFIQIDVVLRFLNVTFDGKLTCTCVTVYM